MLTLHTLVVPAPGADQVLIALHTAGVGPWDVSVREHLDHWENRHYPLVLGVDGAGIVAVPAKSVGHVPAGMSLRDAGAGAVTALTAQQGIDDALHLNAGEAVLALTGGAALEHCIDALKPGGRVAYPSGVDAVPKLGAGVKLVRYDATAGPKEFERLNAAIVATKLQVPIAAEYPLADAAEAQQRMPAGHVLGKLVLRIR